MAGAALMFIASLHADSPAQPSGYSVSVGEHDEYRFVMLVGQCRRGGATGFVARRPGTVDAGPAQNADAGGGTSSPTRRGSGLQGDESGVGVRP